MKGKITINHDSIKNELKVYEDKPAKAIIEYIWNGFDAGANTVSITYKFSDSVDGQSFGYPNLEVIDDGGGWNFEEQKKMAIFLASEKDSEKSRSLPHGSKGVGRCTFYVFADSALWQTVFNEKKFAFKLTSKTLDKYETVEQTIELQKGTKVAFDVSSDKLTQSFFENELIDAIKLEFAWFFKLFPSKKILVNEREIDTSDLIDKHLGPEEIKIDNQAFSVEIVQWKRKLSGESSKYYFLNNSGAEKRKQTTGLNYKSDIFYHSVYIKSDFFDSFYPVESEDDLDAQLPLEKEDKKIYKELMQKIKNKLILMRKGYLIGYSSTVVESWKEKDLLPKKEELAINAEDYEEIMKEVFILAPQLFTNSSDDQKKVIFRLLGSLLGSEEKDYILKILEQVYDLSEDDKKGLVDLLGRTTISNMIRTLKEVDHRLQILDSLEAILFDSEKLKKTLEVDHLQKVLDENFWIFGEEYRLFATTDGSIRKTLDKFKNEILRKIDDEIETKSRKELDLFLTKQDVTGSRTTCIVVEIKRPSITLRKKEYDQIYEYMETILKEPACNGDNIEWSFYLIGNDYDDHIKGLIKNARNWGESDKGLAYKEPDKRINLYVRKWSDIINVEQKSRYRYLKEQLKIEPKPIDEKSSAEIVQSVTTSKKKLKK